jgi:hypothetical protein
MRILLFLIAFLPLSIFSQQKEIIIECENETLENAIDIIEPKYNIVFSYNSALIKPIKVSLPRKKRTIQELLKDLENLSGLQFKMYQNRYVVISDLQQVSDNMGVHNLNVVVVNGYLSKGIKKMASGSYKLRPKDIEILPGLTEFDALESIQMLPGNFSPNETAANFFVRGGYSDQNRLIWDGINLYHKGHLFGMISPLNPHIISDISFSNKGTNARYGERLSSVIDVRTSNKITDSLMAEAGANAINTDVVLRIPIIKNKLSAQTSIRRSYMDVFNTTTFDQLSDKVFDNSQVSLDNPNDRFTFLDANLKVNYKLNEKNQFYASIISIDNNLINTEFSTFGAGEFLQEMAIRNNGYSLLYKHLWTENLKQEATVFFSDYDFNYSSITSENEGDSAVFEKRNVIFDSGISTEFTYDKGNSTYTFGYQYNLKDVGYAFLNSKDLDIVLDEDKNVLQTHGVYASFDFITKFAAASIGLRNNFFKELKANRIEPRFIISKQISKPIKLQLSGEVKNQAIGEIDETVLSDISLENRVWRLANNEEFPIMNSHQFSIGAIYTKKGYQVDIDTYYKQLNNITALSLGFLNPENIGFNIGNQTTYGLDLFAKKKYGAFNTWFSYTLNASKNRFDRLNNANSFRARTGITHLLATTIGYKKKGFNVSIGWRLHTGRPFTFSDLNDRGEFEFNNGINTGELPTYHRLDLSSTYDFNLNRQKGIKGKIGFSVRNAYNKRNLISKEYSGNNSLDDPTILIDKYAIGITPNMMFRVYW